MTGTRVDGISALLGDDGIDGGYCPVTLDDRHPSEGGPQLRRTWMVRTPNGHLGNLGNHDVTEHDDGTITVSPSILVSDHTGELWHGFLEHGVWREC